MNTGETVAVKMMNLTKMSDKFKKRFLPRELASLMEMRHENIIRVYDIFRSNRRIYVFMEFASNGDLARYLKQYGPLSEARSRIWFVQIARALFYLHEEMFTAHRDNKIDNILLGQSWTAKLTDFGFATDATVDADGNPVLSATYCGTLPYYAPQIVRKTPYNAFKADVWAHGVVLYAMTHNRFPFHFKDPKQMVKEQTDEKYRTSRLSTKLSDSLREILLAMLEPDEDKRFTMKQVLEHEWSIQANGTEELSPN